MSRLKTELSWLRRRGAVRTDDDDSAGARTCGRCRAELGLIINRGAPCRACRQRVCKQCREYSVNGRDWVCTVCQKQIDIQLASGEWMNEFVRRPSRRRENKVYVPPADVVKRSLIKRSWTISSPPTADRTSPELREHIGRPLPTPRKPPRGHYAPTDENEPPWDAPQYPPRGAPPRRYSMSSFDGVPSRHLKGPAPPPPRGHFHEAQDLSPRGPFGHTSPQDHHSPQRYSSPESPPVPQRRRVLPELPLGLDASTRPLERPSTLPRKLREPRQNSRQTPLSTDDPNRFHSMPRTRTRSPSGQGRGRSEPAPRSHSPVLPLRENPALGGYVSSGPVTSTPITHDPGLVQHRLGARDGPPTPAPRDLSRPAASVASPSSSGRPPPDQPTPTPTSSLRRHSHMTNSGGRLARSDADLGSLGRLNRPDVEGVSLSRSRSEVDATPIVNNRIPASRADSGVSGSSRGGTSDNSDYDMDPNNPFRKMPPPRGRAAGNPNALTSGFATTGRPRKPSHNPAGVRRSRSFQVGTGRLEDEFPHLKDSLSGQVARYVKELEKGIQMTVENMMPRKPPFAPHGESPRPPPSPSKDSCVSGRSRSLGRRPKDRSTSSPSDTSDSRLEFEERSSSCLHSDHSSGQRHSDTASDIVLDAEKIHPEGDDYKLVFISSDSSKDSELNSSIDSDNSGSPSRRVSSVSAVNDSDTAGFIDESDWDYFESESQAGRRRRGGAAPRNGPLPVRVDACVMTEAEYLSGTASEGEDGDSPQAEDVSLLLSLRVPSPQPAPIPAHARNDSDTSNMTTESQEVQLSFEESTTPVTPVTPITPVTGAPLLAPLSSLDTAELHAMLRQTEAVQAEAQALQAALMGAFGPSDAVLSAIPGARWFRRGDSTRSSAERSVDELSCHDQVRALGSPNDSPALREYRKRVLTEIQNYYGVNQGGDATSSSPSSFRPAEWYGYLARHHQEPPAPARVSPLSSYQTKDKAAKQASRNRGGSAKASASVGAPAAGGARKSSRDICIQTDPALNTSWEEDDLAPEPPGHAPPTPPLAKIQAALKARPHAPTAPTPRVAAGAAMRPGREAGFESTRAAGQRKGEGGGGRGRGQGGGGGGDSALSAPPLPHPPSFHLHLTLSRETSVAQPSDSETDERLLDNSSCVSSDLGGDSASDFEYRDDRGASASECVKCDSKEQGKSEDGGEASVLGAECTRDHGGRGGGEEAPGSPRIAAATTAHAHPSHNTRPSPRPSPPQPAPRRTMSALRSPHKPPAEASQPQENGGDLDASEGVIPPVDTAQSDSPDAQISLVPEDDSSPSSSTSEGEDTDEEMHVSRSYDISLVGNVDDGDSETENIPEGEVGKHLEAEENDSSNTSSSDSDTDEEKHVSREYTLTRSSSTDSGLEKAHSEALDEDEDEESPPQVVSLKQDVEVIEAVNEEVNVDAVDTGLDDVTTGEGEEEEDGEVAVAINKVLCGVDDVVDEKEEVGGVEDKVEEAVEGKEGAEAEADIENPGQHVEIRDVQQSDEVASVRESEEGGEEPASVVPEAEGEVLVEGEPVVSEGAIEEAQVERTSANVDESVPECEVASVENVLGDKMVQSGGEVGNDDGGDVVSASDDVSGDNADTSTEVNPANEDPPAALTEEEKTNADEDANEISAAAAAAVHEEVVLTETVEEEKNGATEEGADELGQEEATQEQVTESSSQAETVLLDAAAPTTEETEGQKEENKEEEEQNKEEEAVAGEEEAVNEEPVVTLGEDTIIEEALSGSLDEAEVAGSSVSSKEPASEEGKAEAGPAASPSGDALTASTGESEPTRESEGSDAESKCGSATVSGGRESPEPPGTSAVDAGSAQVEHGAAASANHTPVPHDAPAGPHASTPAPSADTANLQPQPEETEALPSVVENSELKENSVKCENRVTSVEAESSESGHSSAGESEVEPDDQGNIVKINVTEENQDLPDDGVSIPVGIVGGEGGKQEVRRFAVRRVRSPEVVSRHTPPVPSRRSKRSSSSDGVSSPSDIERSDADASDSADTVVEGGKLHAELRRFALQQRSNLHDHDDKSRDSDGPSSADSVLHGADSECSDNSEEGNLVSIVSVGDEDDSNTRLSSHGRIYIRSDSTDSDVQIKPTCIVVTGSSGAESGEDADGDGEGISVNAERNENEGNDVTILEVTSDGRRGHVMSVHVTSPDSSRSASPARRSQVSELQSMILTTRERQQQFRRSPTEMKESSSGLANYFTLTLGTDSPHAPRRFNKTPEIRRRKIDRPEVAESPTTASPTSPNPTPDHSEGDLLAYEEHHGIDIEEDYSIPHDYDSGEDTERAVSFPDEAMFEEDLFDEAHHFNEADEFSGANSYIESEADGKFDSMEDGESVHSESYYSESSGDEIMEREEELRGYCNRAIDFTLHTIIEESCEESDYERKPKDEEGARAAPSELEKYFYYGLGNGPVDPMRYANEESEYSDTFSETSSSIFSEGLDVDSKYDEDIDPAELASSRLEKYFLLGFERQPSIRSVGEDSELHTDESGSVGSDSECSPSPEQPRKKLVRRPRGFRSGVANRCLATSDRADGAPSDGSHHSEGDDVDRTLVSGEDEGSTESEETAFDKADGQFDTIKRRKKKKSSSDYSDKRSDSDKSELRGLEHLDLEHREEICDLKNAEALKSLVHEAEKVTKRVTIECDKDGKERHDDRDEKEGDLADRKYQSRDSGFIGSSDDLLKDKPEDSSKDGKAGMSSESSLEDGEGSKNKDLDALSKGEENKSDSFDNDSNNNKSETEERSGGEGKVSRSSTGSSVDLPPFCPNKARNKICRKDSFNNWSSDEETNMMMSKMRAFFKTMISSSREAPKGQRVKPPQLLAFEAKLTNLMKTVPGINDEQVKEIVEYLSSEDTWSDSYDSSDYTSSDLEGAYALLDQADPERKSDLQQQISDSCQQIIQKFDQSREPSDTDSAHSLFGGRACSESSEDASPSSRDTVFVYQRLMSSISRMKPDSDRGSIGSGSQGASPPLLAKVMHHIGNRLVALMHEVSGGSENGDDDSLSGGHPVTSSPKVPLFLPRKHKSVDSISIDSSVEKSSLTSTSFESEDSPTDTEQSPESDPGTPKARRRQGPLSIISERSSAEDFTSLESERTVFASHDSPRHHARLDAGRPQQATASQRSLEERGVTNIQYFVTEGSNNEVEVWQSVTIDKDKFDAREHHGVPRARRSARRQEARKAKSHMSLEKIHQEEVKTTGERSESLGDLLDRVRSSEFSSSYEQLDSDSTLKASDSLDRHIGSSSSNFRLNASSRGSLTTSSRGSLAASSRGSLNAGSRGSLQGSSGPEEEDEKKPKKLSFFRYARRSSMPDTSKDRMSPEVRSTTLPRSNPTQVASTASLPRSQSALLNKVPPAVTSTTHAHFSPPPSTLDRLTGGSTGPRSARYHPPGYRPPPATNTPKRTISTPGLPSSLRKDVVSSWAPQDESTGSVDEGVGQKSGSPSPLVGSSGRISGRESVASLASSTDNSTATHPDEEIERLLQINERKRNSLTPLGSTLGLKTKSLGNLSRSESMASVCSAGAEGRYGTVVVKGEIELSLQYNYKEGQLEARVVQCRDLAAVDTKRNRSDPYVKVYLLPDKSKSGKRKTKVKKHTLNPVFDEVLRFTTTMSELDARTLWVSVWHSDMFGRNDFLGEVVIPLADTVFDDVTPKWYPLQEKTEPMDDLSYSPRGDLIMALKFVPPDAVTGKKARRSRGALHVLVKEAKSLASIRPHGTADPVCKGLLLPEKGKASKQKTSVCRKTLNPTWNHTLVFEDTSLQELTERSLELSVWDHDRLGASQFMGGCRLNLGKGKHGGRPVEWMEAAGMEVKLWEQMLERPNLWVEGSIMLRPSMDKPIYSSSMTE